jgi:hypothetical protein
MLVKGFEGGYRFSDKSVDLEPNKLRPIKDIYSHSADATQYLCAGLMEITSSIKKSIPSPIYFPKELRHGAKIL